MDMKKYMKATAKEIHKPFKKTFPRRTLTFNYKDETWAMDLVEMQEWAPQNDGMKYMLNVVDGFTRFAWSRPLSDKSAITTFAAFEDIVAKSGRKPKSLWTDQGKEFYNKWFSKWIKDNDATIYSTWGDHKSVLVERFNRTLKTAMWKLFTEQNTRRWVDMLPGLMSWYNKRVHSTLGMSPMEASKPKNKEEVAAHVTAPISLVKIDKRKPKFELNDPVRISRIKGIFEKGYLPNWSHEIFRVATIIRYDHVDTPLLYGLRDYNDKPISGTFYEQELQKVSPEIADVRLVEKVLKKKGKLALVKWLGISEPQWIPEGNITKIAD